MFFCPELLRKRGHPFFLVWIAATQGPGRVKKYLTPRKLAGLSVRHAAKEVLKRVIMSASVPRPLAMANGSFSLYLTAQLMYGCCVVLDRKAVVLINDLAAALKNFGKMRISSEQCKVVVQVPRNKRRVIKDNEKGMELNSVRSSNQNVTNAPTDISPGEPELVISEEDIDMFQEIGDPVSIDFQMSDTTFFEIHYLDESEEPLTFPHSVPEHTITMQEPLPLQEEEEDTRFGDEGDGGQRFIECLNGNMFEPQSKIVEESIPPEVEEPGHVEKISEGIVPAPSVCSEKRPGHTRRISNGNLQDNISQPEQSGMEELGHADQIVQDHSDTIAQAYFHDNGQLALPGGISDPPLNEIASSVPSSVPAPEIITSDPSFNKMAASVPPQPEPSQLIVPEEESDLIELPELHKQSPMQRKRKRHSHLVIDEQIKLHTSEMEKRIDNKAKDTLRKKSSYEDAMIMLINEKWLNLSAMRQPGRSGNLSSCLVPLFSRHFVTHPEPNDILDLDSNKTFEKSSFRMESPPQAAETVQEETLDGSIPVNAEYISMEDAGHKSMVETTDPSILKPRKSFDTILQELSPSRQQSRFDPISDLVSISAPTWPIEGREQVAQEDHTGGTGSKKRSKEQNTVQNSPKRQRRLQDGLANQELVDSIMEPISHTVDQQAAETTTNAIGDAVQEQGNVITGKGVEDATLMEQRMFSPKAGSSVPLQEKTSQSSDSQSSLLPGCPHVFKRAAELVGERNESKVPVELLCPPANTNRLKAAATFSALLELHKRKHVSLHQNETTDPVFFSCV